MHFPPDSVQLFATVPILGLEDAKLTVPLGVFELVVISGTVAVQEEEPPEVIELGLQVIVDDVVSLEWALLELLPLLPPLLFELAGDGLGECRRNGTRKAPSPATTRAIAPILRLFVKFIFFVLRLFVTRVGGLVYYSRN